MRLGQTPHGSATRAVYHSRRPLGSGLADPREPRRHHTATPTRHRHGGDTGRDHMPTDHELLESFVHGLKRRNPGESEFHQAVIEVAEYVIPFLADKPRYRDAQIL